MAFYLNLFLSFLLLNYCKLETGVLDNDSVEFLIKNFKSVDKLYLPNLDNAINYLNIIIQNSDHNLSQKCKQSLIDLKTGFENREHWAISFFDSSSQGKSGKLFGLKSDFGHFDQCIRSSSNVENIKNLFDGQYCALSIRTNDYDLLVKQNPLLYSRTMSHLTKKNRQWYEYNLGNIAAVCIPSNCEIDQILDIVNEKLVMKNVSITSQKNCTKLYDSKKDISFDLMESIAIFVLGLCLFLAILGTIYPKGLLINFSMITNSKKLVKKVTDKENIRYKCLHGFKFLYILLSIPAHIWFIFMPLIPVLFEGNRNYDIGNIILREFSAGSLYLPDVMFLIGGLLTVVIWYPLFEKTKGKISFFTYTIFRWIRTTPVIVATFFFGFIYPKFGSGPFFNELANHMQTNCKANFWKNLLYVVNFDRGLNMCLPQTWYISVDFQLYLLHYITIFYLYKKPKLGLLIAGLQICISCAYIFWSTYFNQLPAYLRINELTLLSIINTEYHYTNTIVHSNVYTVGIVCGWLMVTKKNLEVKPFLNFLLSLGSFAISLSVFFIPSYWNSHINSRPGPFQLAIWSSLVRLIFICFFVWSFYSFSFGRAKYFDYILNYDFMVPFSRMCLSIVVSQFIYILYYFGTRRETISFNTFDQAKEGIAAFIFCSLAGYLLYLIVEAPFSNLFMHFTKSTNKNLKQNSLDSTKDSSEQEYLKRNKESEMNKNFSFANDIKKTIFNYDLNVMHKDAKKIN